MLSKPSPTFSAAGQMPIAFVAVIDSRPRWRRMRSRFARPNTAARHYGQRIRIARLPSRAEWIAAAARAYYGITQ